MSYIQAINAFLAKYKGLPLDELIVKAQLMDGAVEKGYLIKFLPPFCTFVATEQLQGKTLSEQCALFYESQQKEKDALAAWNYHFSSLLSTLKEVFCRDTQASGVMEALSLDQWKEFVYLHLLVLGEILLLEPIRFAVFLKVISECVSPKRLIQSGIIHRFILVNYALEDSVENFLKTLRQLGLKGAALFDVIIQEKMSISSEIVLELSHDVENDKTFAKVSTTSIEHVTYKKLPAPKIYSKTLMNVLYDFFGNDFLTELNCEPLEAQTVIVQWIRHRFSAMDNTLSAAITLGKILQILLKNPRIPPIFFNQLFNEIYAVRPAWLVQKEAREIVSKCSAWIFILLAGYVHACSLEIETAITISMPRFREFFQNASDLFSYTELHILLTYLEKSSHGLNEDLTFAILEGMSRIVDYHSSTVETENALYGIPYQLLEQASKVINTETIEAYLAKINASALKVIAEGGTLHEIERYWQLPMINVLKSMCREAFLNDEALGDKRALEAMIFDNSFKKIFGDESLDESALDDKKQNDFWKEFLNRLSPDAEMPFSEIHPIILTLLIKIKVPVRLSCCITYLTLHDSPWYLRLIQEPKSFAKHILNSKNFVLLQKIPANQHTNPFFLEVVSQFAIRRKPLDVSEKSLLNYCIDSIMCHGCLKEIADLFLIQLRKNFFMSENVLFRKLDVNASDATLIIRSTDEQALRVLRGACRNMSSRIADILLIFTAYFSASQPSRVSKHKTILYLCKIASITAVSAAFKSLYNIDAVFTNNLIRCTLQKLYGCSNWNGSAFFTIPSRPVLTDDTEGANWFEGEKDNLFYLACALSVIQRYFPQAPAYLLDYKNNWLVVAKRYVEDNPVDPITTVISLLCDQMEEEKDASIVDIEKAAADAAAEPAFEFELTPPL